jgi:hypothetical protein
MRPYFMRLDRLDEYIDAGGIFHPETFLGWAMQGVKMTRSRAVFSTLRADGSLDRPVWVFDAGDVA